LFRTQTSLTVDADPTKTEHFRHWATNRKLDTARCMLGAQLDRIAVSLTQASGESTEFQAEVPFTVCGRPGEHFHREAYRIRPRFTEDWLARMHSLAKVVAEEGTLELTLFASPPGSSARPRASGENTPCVPRPSTRSPNQERMCRT